MFVSCRWSLAFALLVAPSLFGQVSATPTAPPPPVHLPFPAGESTPLGQRIAALLADPQVASSQWGIAVTTLDGTPIYGLNEGKLFRPASNAKVFTSTAAIALLGAQTTFKTRIVGDLQAGGTVRGDLTLVGAGDANFASGDLPYVAPANRVKDAPPPQLPLVDLQHMVDQLLVRGVRRINGDIVGDDTLFPWEPYGESWATDDLVWGYGAPVSALTIADNELKLTITPGHIAGAPGHQTFPAATVALDQNGVDYYTVINQVETHAARAPGEGVNVERDPATRTLRVYGALNEGSQPDTEHIAIDNPPLYAAMALKQILITRGIEVTGQARAHHQWARNGGGYLSQLHTPDACDELTVGGGECAGSCAMYAAPGATLATHTSDPLAEDIVYTMKESQNLHAELLLHHLARRTTCGQGSTVEGARLARTFFIHAGLDPADFNFYDGSGMSAKDLIAPRAAAQLLKFAATQSWFAAWKPSLPEGGVDGTLASRFKDPALAHHIFAKTGTLGETNALSGYVDTASGHAVIFSVLIDDHTPGSSASRKAMDQIVAAIAAEE